MLRGVIYRILVIFMRVLVTGGAGFIGSHLIDRLIKEYNEVVCIDDLSLGSMENIQHLKHNPLFTFIHMNILDTDKLRGVFSKHNFDVVFHLAANSDIERGMKERNLDLNKNFITTFRVLECMKEFGVRKIVFPSTSAIYGEIGQPINEDSGPLFPISFYGASKLAAEAYISAYSNNYDIQAWILRFPNVVGSRATHGIIYDFFKKLKKDPSELWVLGDGKQSKPYLYVHELIDAMLFCFKHANNKINYFNIGTDSITSVRNIAEGVVKKWGMNSKIVYGKEDRGWAGDVPHFRYDLSKICKLGWRPKMSSDQAVQKAIEEIYQEFKK